MSRKLTPEQVLEIDIELRSGYRTGAELARRFGVARDTISRIKRGGLWASVTGREVIPQSKRLIEDFRYRLRRFTITPDGCWIWQGSFDRGQPIISINGTGKRKSPCVVIWEIVNGPIEKGMLVLHSCPNLTCINSDHLYLGDKLDSINMMMEQDRVSKGDNHYHHKLTEKEIPEIRRLLELGATQREVGMMYNVAQSTIFAVKSGYTWRHVA